MSSLLVIVSVAIGLALVGAVVACAVVWVDRHQRRAGDQASTIHALQMSLFSVTQAAERHHDAVALNGARMEGTTTTPAGDEADARTAAATYVALVRDRRLKALGSQILDVSAELRATTSAANAVRLQAQVSALRDRFRERKVDVVRDLSRRRFSRV